MQYVIIKKPEKKNHALDHKAKKIRCKWKQIKKAKVKLNTETKSSKKQTNPHTCLSSTIRYKMWRGKNPVLSTPTKLYILYREGKELDRKVQQGYKNGNNCRGTGVRRAFWNKPDLNRKHATNARKVDWGRYSDLFSSASPAHVMLIGWHVATRVSKLQPTP